MILHIAREKKQGDSPITSESRREDRLRKRPLLVNSRKKRGMLPWGEETPESEKGISTINLYWKNAAGRRRG